MNDSTKFETLLRSDRESERKVSRRMLVTWFAAVAVMALWLAVYRFYS